MRPQTKLMDIIPDLYFLWVLPLIASSTTLGSALHGVFFVEAKYHTRFSCSCVPFLMFFFFFLEGDGIARGTLFYWEYLL